jgi:hypothetical protein
MSSLPSGLFGNVLRNSELSREALSRASPQRRIFEADVNAKFYDTYLQKLEETGDDKRALHEAQEIVHTLEDEFQEKAREIQHQARTSIFVKADQQGKGPTSGLLPGSKETDLKLEDVDDYEEEDEDEGKEKEDVPEMPDGQKAMHAFSKLQIAISKISAMGKFFQKPKDPPEFLSIRTSYQKLIQTVDAYDGIMEYALNGNIAANEKESAQKLRDSEISIKRKLVFEYEKKIDHNNCNALINSLTKELAIIKEELLKTTTSYGRLQAEVQDLRIFKSNAEAEAKLLVNELAKRRARCSVLRKRLAAVSNAKQGDRKTEEAGASCSENQCTSDANRNGGGDTTEAGEGNDSGLDEQVSEYYANNGTKRPKWNNSTTARSRTAEALDVVSQKSHDPNIESKQSQGTYFYCLLGVDRVLNIFKADSSTNTHQKCQKEIERLKRLLSHEGKERKKLSQTSARKQIASSQVGKVLQDCMQALDEQNNLNAAPEDEDLCLNEETVSLLELCVSAHLNISRTLR